MPFRISKKGQVVIPAKLRAKFGLQPGDHVSVAEENGRLLVTPLPRDPIKALHGFLKGGPSLTEELLADRRWEEEHEEQRLGQSRHPRLSERGTRR